MRLQPKLRPTFFIPLAVPGDAVMDALRDGLAAPDAPCVGQVLTRHAFVRPPRDRRTLLSPSLNLEIEDHGGSSRLRCRFAPHPNVWTGFVAVLAIIGLLGFAGLMWGFAQMTVKEPPWALLAFPASLLLMAFVTGASFIGQGLSATDMCQLRRFLDEILTAAGNTHSPDSRP